MQDLLARVGQAAEDLGPVRVPDLAVGSTAEITIESDTYQITIEDGIGLTAPRTTSRDIKRHKASHYPPG